MHFKVFTPPLASSRFNSDNFVIFLSTLYITLPVVIFFLGWLKTPLAIFICIPFLFFLYKIKRDLSCESIKLFRRATLKYWIFTTILCALWVGLSGIGGFSYQNYDHFSRNAVFRDLCNCPWPIFYDLSKESEIVQQTLGDNRVALVYYFSWWLPVSGLSRLFHLKDLGRNLFLYLWALLGILLIIYCINRYLKKCSYLVPIILICFSGLDMIPFCLMNLTVGNTFLSPDTFTSHIEWWAGYFQYSSNTSQLYWVFNQAIPVWLITALLLQSKNTRYNAALSSLAFAYSPWATFGMVPFVLYDALRKKSALKASLNLCNIIIPFIMLMVYGSFYLAGNGSMGGHGLIFSKYPGELKKILYYYIIFLFVETGIYFLIIHKYAHTCKFYTVVLSELLLFPLFYIKDLDLCMRGSIPALFLLMVFIIHFLLEQPGKNIPRIRKAILAVILLLGAFTPFCEINRSIQQTFSASSRSELLQEQVYSFENMRTDDSGLIANVSRLFFAEDYENTFFFKELAK